MPRLALTLCAIAFAGASVAVGGIDVRTAALSGQAAPSGGVFSNFQPPVINSGGEIAFEGNSTGGAGIWSEGGGQGLSLVALNGAQAEGEVPGNTYFGLFTPLISDAGETAFFAGVMGPSIPFFTFRQGVWRHTPGSGVSRVVSSGAQAPDLAAGVTFYESAGALPAYIDTLVMNRAGEVNLLARVESSTPVVNDTGIWSEAGGGGLSLRILRGDAAPGVGGFSTLSYLTEPGPVMDDDGDIAFLATMSGVGVGPTNNLGIWRDENGGNRTLIARTGDAPPGLPLGVTYVGFRSPKTSPSGRLVFESGLAGPGITDSNNVAIWAEGGAGLQRIVQTGDPLPDDPSRNFGLVEDPIINSQGKVVFTGGFSSFNSIDIWSKTLDGDIQAVAREDEQAPGLANFVRFQEFQAPVINALGQVAFAAEAGTSIVGNDLKTGIWAETTSGQLTLIAAEGETLDVSDDPLAEDLRTIDVLRFADTTIGQRTPFNDAGQIAFSATFTDGTSGVFVSSLVAPVDLPGDYNDDGRVDAADYTVWRDRVGTPQELGSYQEWRDNFGAGTSSASLAMVVPEPSACAMLIAMFARACGQRRRP